MTKNKQSIIETLRSRKILAVNELEEQFMAVQILPELKKRYPTQLRSEILSIRFYQTETACYMEITELKNPDKQRNEIDYEVSDEIYSDLDYLTERTSLSFIWNDDDPLFKPSVTIEENAFTLLEDCDDETMINCMDFFSEQGAMNLSKGIKE